MKNTIPVLIFSMLLMPVLLRGQIITNPDTVFVSLYDTVFVDVLANDYELNNDSIFLYGTSFGSGVYVRNNRLLVAHMMEWQGKRGWFDPIDYYVRQANGTHKATGQLHIYLHNESYASLDINNLNARFYALGHHFWDFKGESKFFALKNTAQIPIFNSSFWIGGIESNSNQLHVSAERYRQLGEDFNSGPVSSFYHSSFEREWGRVWKLTTNDILHHIANYARQGYTPIRDIAEWPANGDISQGQLAQMAPFQDRNRNGIYEPMDGDYPLIRGDMTLFFVFSDLRRPNTESGGIPLGIEVHGMAYAFDQPDDSMLNNTIFLHYDIINRSDNQYNDTWLGLWFSGSLGSSYDDYFETHVKHGAACFYNGNPVDGSGQPWSYGAKPPVFGIQFLAGSYMDPDGIDNPRTDSAGNRLCDVSLNGAFFGDGIVDNERLGLAHTLINHKHPPGVLHQATIAVEYHLALRGIWRDSTRLIYGGSGHPLHNGYGPGCSFIFPGDTDPCNFGTGGLLPNGPALWTEKTAGRLPGDRNGIASSGPFTFMPDQRQELDVAFIFARDQIYDKPYDTLVDWMGKLKSLFEENPGMFKPRIHVSQKTTPSINDLNLYPNPAGEYITISGITELQPTTYQIFGITGQLFAAGSVKNLEPISIAHLTPGIYIIRIAAGHEMTGRKFVKGI